MEEMTTHLTGDAHALLGVAGDHGEAADALAVEAEVLGEGLTEHHVVAVRDELADRVCVSLSVTGGETLQVKTQTWSGEKYTHSAL